MEKQQTQAATRIITARAAVGITRSEAARRLGIPLRTLTNYERSERTPDDFKLSAIVRALEEMVQTK